jgi:hypothetical protein
MIGISTSASEKKDKQLWSRRRRRVVRHHVKSGNEDVLDPVAEIWEGSKDGKRWIPNCYFFSEEYTKRLMRK